MKKGGRPVFMALALTALFALMLFPVFWLTLTALRPESEVFYVHRGTHLTLANFAKAWRAPKVQESFVNSAVLATLATIFSLQVTVLSGYMLSRFKGATSKIWFTTIYLFRTVPYITRSAIQSAGIRERSGVGHHVQDATEHVLDERKPNAEPLQLALERGILPGDVQQLQQL